MVFIHFPSNRTDEEKMLETKYSKLRKKKKLLERMKDPKPEPEKVNPLKRPLDPKDAKELAKKLIMSGKVSLPHKMVEEKKTVFKRPRTLERRILSTGRSEGHGGLTPGYSTPAYQNEFQFEPFTPGPHMTPMSSSSESESPSVSHNNMSPSAVSPPRKIAKQPVVSKKEQTEPYTNAMERSPQKTPMTGVKGQPKRGPTIYVQNHSEPDIKEDMLRQHFGKFGKIINIKLNSQKVGFITFDKVENAEVAIQEMNGTTIDDMSYEVQFARRQPNITQLINDASASASWTAIATSHSQKSNFQDKRQQVVYDDPMEA